MFAHSLQSIAESGIWTAYCQTKGVDGCGTKDCADTHFTSPLIDQRQLPWSVVESCSVHALTSAVFLIVLFLWSISVLRKACKPIGQTERSGENGNKRSGEDGKNVFAPRARGCFIASISLSAFLFVANLFLGLFLPSLPLHVTVTTWISCGGWLAVIVAANQSRGEETRSIPFFVRTWWIAAFVLSLFSLVPNVVSYRESHQFTILALLETASVLITTFLFIVAVIGRTGVTEGELDDNHDGLKEPLLGGASTEESSTEEAGVTAYATAGFFSLVSNSWLTPLIAKGYKKRLELKDIPFLAPKDTSHHNFSKLRASWEQQKEKDPTLTSPSLNWAIVQTFWVIALANALLAGANTVANYVGPFLIEDFVEYLAGRRRFAYEGYVLVLAFFLAKIVENFTGRLWYQGMQLLGLKVRAALTGFAYKKGLNLSNQSRQGHTSGEIVNYVIVDAQRIGDFSWWFHDIWVLPLQVLLALLILLKVVGAVPALAALGTSILMMVANIPVSKMQDAYQDKLMAAKDKRTKALTEVLRSMRILKLQAWESQYLSKVEGLRKVEYRHLRAALLIRATMTFFFWTAPMFVSVATFGTCALIGTPLTAGRILSALATFRILQEPLREAPEFISMMAQTKVSLQRLQKYFAEEELQEDAVSHSPAGGEGEEMAIEISEAEFKWDPSADRASLENVSLQVKKGQRVAICGTVGSGKSSLLSCILGEISRVSGSVKVCGATAYVAQTAWIQSKKIEENVLFGKPMDRKRYDETIKACALEKDMDVFANGDQTIVGERGINMSGGQKQRIQLARAVYQDADIYLLDDPFSAVDAHTGSELFTECILGVLSSKTVLYVTHQVEFLPAADIILVMRDGKIVQAGKYDELLQAGTDFTTLVNAHNEAIDLMVASGYKKEDEEQDGPSKVEDLSPDIEESTTHIVDQLTRKKSVEEIVLDKKVGQLVEEEERAVGNTSFAIYWAYITSVYKGGLVPVIILAQILFQILQVASNYWMAWATPATEDDPMRVNNTTLIVIYCILAFGSAIAVSARAVLLSVVGLLAAQKFFMNMLRAIFQAPMGFFDSTPTGRILARASSDQDILDQELLFNFSNVMVTFMQLVAIISIMSQITWQICLLFVPVIIACILMQRFYIKTARDIQRFVGTLKSPIIHHYTESIAGAVTIRGFGQDQRFLETILEVYNTFGKTVFHNFSAIQWLMFRMDMLSTCVFVFSLLYAITFIDKMDPGLAGLAVTYGLQLNMIQSYFIWTFCYMENRIISVERILQYTRIEKEAPAVIEETRPPAEWPSQGTIELHDVQVRYSENSPLVLHGVTCTFPAGQKIGVVGRTASGKSTLIQAIFRLVEPCGGKIVIDGIDISSIGLHDLRQKLSIIPQEPTLFEGTMRVNLDPLEQYTDAEVWQALDKCQLGDIIREKEEKLDCPVNENGENWSVGQRQLVCLGRALLKRTSILVLDEATASVDSATDGVIQRTIRAHFGDCTVITVAHRIPTVIDSDATLVLSYGRVAEYNSPLKLLEDKNSLFYKLVSEYSTRSKSKDDTTHKESR